MIRSKYDLVKSIHYAFIIGMILLSLCGIISFIIVFTLGKEQLTPENIRFIVPVILGVFFLPAIILEVIRRFYWIRKHPELGKKKF